MSWQELSIAEIADKVRSGEIKADQLVKDCLDRIKEAEQFHPVLEVNPAALDKAREIDKKPAGKLAGVPFMAKDNFLTSNTHTTAASHILEPFEAPYQSTAIEKLEAEGAILVAKANLDAFAHGSSTENSDFGPTRNPWDEQKVPGGSSGGSAAAVGLGLAAFALGTDTGGSIRLPAAFCGVVGLKPTYGLVSRYGVIAMGSSVDVIGPITKNVEDAALVLEVMAGKDSMDATTIDRDKNYSLAKPKSGLKVGLVKEYLGEGVEPAVKDAVMKAAEELKQLGASVEEVSLPSVELALPCYYILVPAEISSNLSRYDGIKFGYSSPAAKTLQETYSQTRGKGFGAEAKRRIMIGTYVLSSGYYDAYYHKAQQVRTLLVNEFNKAFEKIDLLLGPTSPTTAFDLGSKSKDPVQMYLTDVMTVAANLVGAPAISLPAGKDGKGLPIGIQLIGPQKSEAQLLSAAAALEAELEKVGLKL